MISCKAPCKVNVSLRVLGKRADGFHEVDTVMVPLELCDVLEFSRRTAWNELRRPGSSAG